ncbi:MAG: NAD(P)-dependent oxidoreductase [Acidobacteriota bacterium]|nr:NAD(P)-dependent oxidoreductase [Acidobacteriota bacterium]
MPVLNREMRTIVFGASGFIGRWVSRRLCFAGVKPILVVRDLATAKPIFADYQIGGEIIQADVQRLDSVAELIGRVKPDVVFNLAGYGVDRSERDEETAYRINAHLVEAICKAMAVHRNPSWAGQNIIHVGSALEYGEIGGNLAEDSVVNPTTLYGKSKLMGTNLLTQFCRKLGVRGITSRLFTVYGTGEHDGRLLPSLFNVAKDGKPLPLTAGEQKRDFTYVEDIADGLLRLAVAESQPGEVVNLATGRLTTVRRFIETAASILNIPETNLQFGAIPTRAEEMQHDDVTVDRLRRITGWTPPTEIAEGIQQTIAQARRPRSQEKPCVFF